MPITPIHLDRTDPEPLYRQIERQLRAAIEDGRLRPGTSLPGIRSLARALNVAPNTVVLAYEQLASEGYVIGHVGSGTQVAEELPETYLHTRPTHIPTVTSISRSPGPRLPRPVDWAPSYAEPAGQVGLTHFDVDFRPIEDTSDRVPTETWARVLTTVLREMTEERALSGGRGPEPRGDARLREALAAYLGAARAVRCTADEVIITPGARATSALIARIFTAPGSLSATEDPGDPGMLAALRIAGGDVVSVPIDRDGIRVDRLPSEACIVHVTPSWQFPTGGTMPMRRREQLLAWAHETGALIIEDDREGELRYEGPSLPSLQGMDRDGRVVYVAASRRFMLPGLDLSYAVVPPGYVDRFLGMIHVDGQSPGELSQRAFARFIEEGHFERYLRRLRLVLAARQAALTETIDQELGWLLRADRAPAGSHLLVRVIDPAWTGTAVAELAARCGLALTPTRLLHADRGGPDRELLVPYAAHGSDEIRIGLRRLARVARGGVPVVAGVGAPGGSNGPDGSDPGGSDPGGSGPGGSGRGGSNGGGVSRPAPERRRRPPTDEGGVVHSPVTIESHSPFAFLPEPRLYRVSGGDAASISRPAQRGAFDR